MALSEDILKKVNKKFEPEETINLRFRGYDIVLKTDTSGNAIQMFMGKADANGKIKGDRYARVLKYDRDGAVIKDHWDRKGKASL